MVIVGEGFIGNTLKNYDFLTSGVVYVKGVSNSSDLKKSCLQRDFDSLQLSLEKYSQKRFIYISTCSAFDIHNSYFSPYIRHKVNLENYVLERPNSTVIRVPNLIGARQNSSNLFEYLVDGVLRQKEITIWSRAYRNFLTIEDLGRCIDILMVNNKSDYSRLLPIANIRDHSVREVLNLIEKILKCKANVKMENKGTKYHIPAYTFWKLLPRNDPIRHKNYLEYSIRDVLSGK